jgi:hypothetical protein
MVVWQGHFEQMEASIDSINEADLLSQQMKGANTTVGNGVDSLGYFVLDIAGVEHRSGAIAEPGFVETIDDFALAGGQLIGYRLLWISDRQFVVDTVTRRCSTH